MVACPICLETKASRGDPFVSAPCGHMGHRSCITGWMKSKNQTTPKCPSCMQEFEEEELRRHYLGSSSPPPEEAPTPEPSSPPPAEDLAIEALIEDVDDIVEQAKRAAGGTDQDRKRLFRMVRSCGKKLAVFEDLDDDSKTIAVGFSAALESILEGTIMKKVANLLEQPRIDNLELHSQLHEATGRIDDLERELSLANATLVSECQTRDLSLAKQQRKLLDAQKKLGKQKELENEVSELRPFKSLHKQILAEKQQLQEQLGKVAKDNESKIEELQDEVDEFKRRFETWREKEQKLRQKIEKLETALSTAESSIQSAGPSRLRPPPEPSSDYVFDDDIDLDDDEHEHEELFKENVAPTPQTQRMSIFKKRPIPGQIHRAAIQPPNKRLKDSQQQVPSKALKDAGLPVDKKGHLVGLVATGARKRIPVNSR